MQVWHMGYEKALHIMQNLRELDAEEAYSQDFVDDPIILALSFVSSPFGWILGKDGEPICAIGASPLHPGVWQVYMLGTSRFSEIAISVTRFAKRIMLPALLEIGVHRIEARAPSHYTAACRWLELLGGELETVLKQYGRDRQDFCQYVMLTGDQDGAQEGQE